VEDRFGALAHAVPRVGLFGGLGHGALLTLYGRVAWLHDFGDGSRAWAIFQALLAAHLNSPSEFAKCAVGGRRSRNMEEIMLSTQRACLVAFALTLSLTGVAHADLIWVAANNGNVPPGAVVGGQERTGETLYVCRANFNNAAHGGKVRNGFRGCNIGYGGREEEVPNYEVLVERRPRWVAARDGNIPADAVPIGQESGIELFVCRGRFQNGIHSGKIQPAFRACNIGFGGKEETINPYEVLVTR
jgi:hypothetical protein